MHIVIDRTRCNGMGLCEMTAPEIFEVGDDGQAALIGEVTTANPVLIDEAVTNCPTSALSVAK